MSPQRSTLRLFLSSNTQDFIEVRSSKTSDTSPRTTFLSSNTQDFIEVIKVVERRSRRGFKFLSSNTQDFIEVGGTYVNTWRWNNS